MTTIYTSISVGIGTVAALVVTWLVAAVVTVPPVRMELEYLRYEDGHFLQHISIQGADAVTAEWSARIWRDDGERDAVLCSGGGNFPYNGEPSKPMTPSYWTDDECPSLKPGDQALAVWSYRAEDGVIRSISAEITIP